MGQYIEIKKIVVTTPKERDGTIIPLQQNPATAPVVNMTYDAGTKTDENRVKNFISLAEDRSFIFNNEFVEGFEFVDTRKTSATSNCYFRIYDPRGFVADISCDSALHILQGCTIENGIITSPCIWARKDLSNTLIAKDSYNEQQYLADLELKKTPCVKPTTLQKGQYCTFCNGESAFYIGRLQINTKQVDVEINKKYNFKYSVKSEYKFYVFGTLNYYEHEYRPNYKFVAKPEIKKVENNILYQDTFNKLNISADDVLADRYISPIGQWIRRENNNLFITEPQSRKHSVMGKWI